MSPKLFSLAMSQISDRYIQEALAYQPPAKRHGTRALRTALAACLAILLALGTAMAVSPEFRQAVAGWMKARYETFTHYEYRSEEGSSGGEDGTSFVPHDLTELPPGYTEVSRTCDTELGQQLILYRNEETGKMCFVTAGSGGNAFVEAEGYTVRPVEVSGAAGEVYILEDPAKDSSIVWTEGTMFFCISGSFTPEELVYYAERFRPVS